jgi:hypothetical protein
METSEGPLDMVAPPARVVGDSSPLGSVPALDEHGQDIRAEFSA